MLSLYTAYDVQHELRDFIKRQLKQQKITVEVLSKRSGVPYSTIRKFERTGNISLRQFLMLLEAVGELNPLHQLTKERKQEPTTIAEVNTPLNVKRKLSDGCHLLVGQLAETQQPPTLVGGC